MTSCPYHEYYLRQAGGGTPIFYGARQQNGHGLGSIFSSLGKVAFPLLKYLGKRVLSTGANIVRDVIDEGKDWREASQQRLVNTGQTMWADAQRKMQGGGAYKRRKYTRRAPLKAKKPRKKRVSDIYD